MVLTYINVISSILVYSILHVDLAPQRIIWPRVGNQARRFSCVDFFQPSQRLTAEQMLELLRWLTLTRAESDRGRYGYAQYLASYGPPNIKALPHGKLLC